MSRTLLVLVAALVSGQITKSLVVTRKSVTFEVWQSDGGRYGTITKVQALALLATWRAQNDGGTAREALAASGLMLLDDTQDNCSCSDGVGVCQMDPGDGGLVDAPLYQTNHGATGTGCVLKPCIALWVDGGETWPVECPGG